jgi:hypothetical protein
MVTVPSATRTGHAAAPRPRSRRAIERYDSHRGAVDLGRLWTLTRNGEELAVYVFTHPLPGWELRLVREAEVQDRTTVSTVEAVFSTAEAWRTRAERQGWAEQGGR